MIFDIKMEDFRRKARLFAGGHVTKPLATTTYASVVSSKTICISLTVADLNDMQVKTVDIQNDHIKSPVPEKICTALGTEFGIYASKSDVAVRYLYGLKSSGSIFWNHFG